MTLFSKKPTKRCVPDDKLRWSPGPDLFALALLAVMEKVGVDDKALMDEMRERVQRNNIAK